MAFYRWSWHIRLLKKTSKYFLNLFSSIILFMRSFLKLTEVQREIQNYLMEVLFNHLLLLIHFILDITNIPKEENIPKTASKGIDLKSNFKKHLIHFGSFKRKDIRLFKKILKGQDINNCSLKISKKRRKPILYVNGEKLGPLATTLPKILKKYKTKS